MGVRGDQSAGDRHGHDRPLGHDAVTADPAGRARRERADRPAAVPRFAGGALPGLRAVHEPLVLTALTPLAGALVRSLNLASGPASRIDASSWHSTPRQ